MNTSNGRTGSRAVIGRPLLRRIIMLLQSYPVQNKKEQQEPKRKIKCSTRRIIVLLSLKQWSLKSPHISYDYIYICINHCVVQCSYDTVPSKGQRFSRISHKQPKLKITYYIGYANSICFMARKSKTTLLFL